MRILITSYDFLPKIGGMQTASDTLARGLAARGHDVTLVTETPNSEPDNFPFKVVRNPDAKTLFRLARDADVVWQNHISLRLLWPALLLRRPLIFMHHIWLDSDVGSGTQYGEFKRLICKLGLNCFVSTALRDAARLDGPIIPNAYNDDIFRFRPEITPKRDVAFLGRLTRVKGVDLLVEAIGMAAKDGAVITATVIGVGPEDANLKAQAENLGVSKQIIFSGPLQGEALAQELSRHRIVVIPSRWEEPFGIVALEAMASGCVVAVANSGALPEVIETCGQVFNKNDAASLASTITDLVAHPEKIAAYRANIPAHLQKYTVKAQIDACEALLETALMRTNASAIAVK